MARMHGARMAPRAARPNFFVGFVYRVRESEKKCAHAGVIGGIATIDVLRSHALSAVFF